MEGARDGVHHHLCVEWNVHCQFAFFRVQDKVEAAGAGFGQLTEHNVLGNAFNRVHFCMHSGLHQNINRFFEGTSHQCAHFLSIDSVTSDRHQITFCRHHIAEQCQMAIIHIGSIE